jgi:hypothetical protein
VPQGSVLAIGGDGQLGVDGKQSTELGACRVYAVPKIRALYEATFFAGLRKAGVPEE